MIRFKKVYTGITALAMMLATSASAKEIEMKSPDGDLKVILHIDETLSYDIYHGTEPVLENGALQMTLRDQTLGLNPKLSKRKTTQKNETIHPVVPLKHASIENRYCNEQLDFKGGYSIVFRLYDDAVAYRFVTSQKGDVEILDETCSIDIPQGTVMHLQQPAGFKTAYEEAYSHMAISDWKANDRMSTLPVLMKTPAGYNILISEADLYDYPCLFFQGEGEKNRIHATFPKVPLEFGEDGDRSVKILKEADYIARTTGSRAFPWRYFYITKNDADLLEQTMPDKLAAPSCLDDTSWIKPGQTAWEWWNAASPYGEGVDFVSGFNMATYKYFIDFAARYGIPYILMDEGWAMSTRDPYTPNPEVNVHEIIRYGKEKGVKVILWFTWLTVENHFDVFKTLADWGVAGLKIDFMDRSDQWMVNYYERVAKEAAKYHLFVDMHGSFKPAGLEKRYPNILSYEGVRGMEQMGGCFPNNSLYLPFMRNAVGAMDYTPGAMISMQPEVYHGDRPNSASIGTRAYQMALYVVFESGVQMLADNPTMYYRNPDCTDFITRVPVVWDETRVLDAKVGEYVVVARRKGDSWFVGAITNNSQKTRQFDINLDFLSSDRSYQMTSFEDGINAGRQAMDYRQVNREVNAADQLTIKLVRNGGWVARFE